MGDTPPYPNPVAFNAKLADDLLGALRDAVSKLRSQASDRQSNATRLRQNWKGPYAAQFDGEVRRMGTQASSLIGVYQGWISSLESAKQSAHDLQSAHDRANQDWQNQQPHPNPAPARACATRPEQVSCPRRCHRAGSPVSSHTATLSMVR